MSLTIRRLDFNPWGCFVDHSLSFEAKSGQVELVYGPNASGKSTTSRGERSLLYGIDVRTQDSHTHPYPDLRIGACLEMDGETIELSRRKRRGHSLSGADGKPVAQETLQKALGGLSEDIYRGLFQVDHDTLVKGGAELLQGQGEIGASLFAAAAGIATLHETLAGLDGEAEALFNPRARTTVLHQALRALHDAERRLRVSTLRPARHRELTRAITRAEEACMALATEIREVELRALTLERRRALAPLLDAHGARAAELDTLNDTPELPGDAATRRADAQGRIRAGEAALMRAREGLERLVGEIDAIPIDERLLARADEIRVVKERISAISKARGDRRKREGELQETAAALKSAAAVIGLTDPEEVQSLARGASAQRGLDGHLTEHDELRSRRASAGANLNEAGLALQGAREELDTAPTALDTGALEVAVTSALKAGALVEQIEQLRVQGQLAEREAKDRLARLHPAPPSVEELRVIGTPSREQAQRAATERQALEQEARELAHEHDKLAEVERELSEECELRALVGEVPSAAAIAEIRGRRGARWAVVREAALGVVPLPAEAAVDYERTVAEADELADRRVEQAAEIERSASLQARSTRLQRDCEQFAEREHKLKTQVREHEQSWQSAWAVSGLASISALDATAWLADREEILALDRSAVEHDARARALASRERGHRDALADELASLGEQTGPEATAETLLACGQALLAQCRDQASARTALMATMRAAERALASATREREEAEAEWAEWERMWPQRRAQAGLPDTATPQAAQEIVRAVQEGLALLSRKQDLERRIAGIDTDQDEFQNDVRVICADVVPEFGPLEPERAAGALHARLAEQERAIERRETLMAQHSEGGKELEAIESELMLARAEIAAMLAAAGVQSVDELPTIEARAARAQTLRVELAELEGQVQDVGEGRFEELQGHGADFDRAAAAVEIEELHERAEELRQQRDDAKERLGEQKRELGRVETDTTAVQAAQDVALARAAVGNAATEHARARLAATVVRHAIERYRRLHQDPLLERANRLFTRFTLGSFVELFVDVDERGRGVLMARQRDRVLLQMEGLSKGTREQLFLALRIAAIERYVASAGPVPVIFDDVFIESDEPRSERIFAALGELAARTQVIVLTHHHHLIDVGRRALGENLLIQSLPDAAPVLREAVAA
jgi:uncharacterized protein YhaN